MNYLDKLNRDYPFKEQPTFIKKLSMLVDRSIDVLKAYKQLTGQEPPGGNLDLKILDELLNAEIINTAVRPAYINAIKGRLADNLFKGVIQPQKDKDHFIWLAKSRQTQKVIVKAAVKLRYDALLESKEIVSAPKLTPQDREVYDAVSTLWQAGNAVMTYAIVSHNGRVNPAEHSVIASLGNSELNVLREFPCLIDLLGFVPEAYGLDRLRSGNELDSVRRELSVCLMNETVCPD